MPLPGTKSEAAIPRERNNQIQSSQSKSRKDRLDASIDPALRGIEGHRDLIPDLETESNAGVDVSADETIVVGCRHPVPVASEVHPKAVFGDVYADEEHVLAVEGGGEDAGGRTEG